MKLPLFIARRYLFSKKNKNVINIISIISVVAVAVGTAAIIIVMTAFNGLEHLVASLYASFDPDIKVQVIDGKTFEVDRTKLNKIKRLEGVEHVTVSLEEIALIRYQDKNTVATVKGVTEEFAAMTGIDSLVCEGDMVLEGAGNQYAVMGYGISYHLSFYPNGLHGSPISVYVPKPSVAFSLNPEKSFNKQNILPVGVFCVGPDFDNKYVLVPYRFMENLLEKKGYASSIEVGVADGADAFDVKDRIEEVMGNKYEVKTREELNELIFKTNKTEKWIVFMILSFILFIATFNTLSNITMLIIEKQKDIWILKSMGAENKQIRNIFFSEGMMINLLGGAIGLVAGLVLCLLQIHVGLLRMEGAMIEFYPMKLEPLDFILTTGIVISTGFVSSWYPVYILTKRGK